jgi:hypothetical protein
MTEIDRRQESIVQPRSRQSGDRTSYVASITSIDSPTPYLQSSSAESLHISYQFRLFLILLSAMTQVIRQVVVRVLEIAIHAGGDLAILIRIKSAIC